MNKFGIVLGVAVVATLAGCKDPDYRYSAKTSQNEVKNVAPVVEAEKSNKPVVEVVKPEEPKIVVAETKPQVEEVKVEAEKPAPVVETTEYIVQRGDYLSKISKKFNIKIDAIRKLNPQIKKDVIRIGQKIKLPGKIEVGEQTVPAGAFAKPKTAATTKKAFVPYTGATKEYVVKSGDTLGAIAYSNGINIRQLKQMNSITKDNLKIGQKLKIPAGKAEVAAPVKAVVESKPVDEAKPAEAPVEAVAMPVEPTPAEPVVAPETPAVAAPAEVEAPVAAETKATDTEGATQAYTVREGEDILDIAIKWGVSSAEIRELNNLADDAEIKPGMTIKLPAEANFQ